MGRLPRHLVFLAAAVLLCGRAWPDLQVNLRKDTVVLTDGTEVDGVVLMITARGVLLVQNDAKDPEKKNQRLIPRDDVVRIEYGETQGVVAGYQTGTESTRKVIQGTGFHQEEAKDTKTASAGGGK